MGNVLSASVCRAQVMQDGHLPDHMAGVCFGNGLAACLARLPISESIDDSRCLCFGRGPHFVVVEVHMLQ